MSRRGISGPEPVHEKRCDGQTASDILLEDGLPVAPTAQCPRGTPDAQLLDDVFAYDATGRVVRQTTPWSLVTAYDYTGTTSTITIGAASPIVHHDPLGRTASVVDRAGGQTTYSYGPFGALLGVEAPDHTETQTLHDAYGRVTQRDDPDTGTTVSHYDGFGDLTTSTDALGRQVTLTYDALGRLTEREDLAPNGSPASTTWTWDTAPLGATGRPALGRLAQLTSPGGQKTLGYDNVARPLTTTLAVTGDPTAPMVVSLGYDPLGRVGTITYPFVNGVPFVVRHDYDSYGHLMGVDDTVSGVAYWRLSRVDGAGRITGETFGNGVETTRSYFGDRQRLASIVTTGAGATLQDLAYDYDPRLNLSKRTDALQARTEHFRYDALDRLVCSYFRAPAQPGASAACARSWAYDAGGNVKAKDGVAYRYDDPLHPHAVTSVGSDTYAYDDAGDQIGRSGATAQMTYTPFDLPSAFSTAAGDVTLDYDGDEQRIRKSVPGGDVTEYLGDLYERVTHADGTVDHRYYVHGPERMVAVVTVAGAATSGPLESALYVHGDNLGSVDAITDEDGALVEKRSYEAFGERRSPVWGQPPPASFTSATTRGFTGHEEDDELGLVNMKGRIYDPALARFLTPDPLVSRPFYGQSYNPYSYVLNNPLALVDPSGFGDGPPPGCDATCRQDSNGQWYTVKQGPPAARRWPQLVPGRRCGSPCCRRLPGGRWTHAASPGDAEHHG